MTDLNKEHPQHAEVARLLAHLTANGFKLVSVDDGEDRPEMVATEAQAVEVICGVDDSTLAVMHPDWSKLARIAIVLGNGPGELASDYTDRQPLTKCLEDWSDAEEARANGVETTPSDLFVKIPYVMLGCELADKMANAALDESNKAANVAYCATIAKRGLMAATGLTAQDDPETAMNDFVVNMMHLAEVIGVDFESVLESARNHYGAEKNMDDLPSEKPQGKSKTV